MKQIFAIFFALCVFPCFHSYAWIGGPFSNNSYFSENGDDGVYEAVAIPSSGGVNGVGLYRWAVANNINGVTDDDVVSTSTVTFDNQGNIASTLVNILPATSNIYFGGLNRVSHSWFIQGVSYVGFCQGTANSGLGIVSVTGNATDGAAIPSSIGSGFTGPFGAGASGGDGIPIQRFNATGFASLTDVVTPANNVNFTLNVFGSKVSSQVIYNGVTGT